MFHDIDLTLLLDQLVYQPDSPLIFNSGFFLFFFLLFSVLYYLLRNKLMARLLFVTICSYYFYYKSSGAHFAILAVITISDFFIAKAVSLVSRNKARYLLALGICIDLGLLAYFKYTNFLVGIWNDLSSHQVSTFDILLPVGISFYIFQSLSYTIDVFRKKIKPLDSLVDYAFYVSFFPQLVAGPIVRAVDFIPQIRQPLKITNEMLSSGIFMIISGLIKKAIISDYISLNFVDRIFEQPELYSGLENLIGIYGYALQIYCDFSGYSDMAIGLALLLGFKFPKNFNAPYKSASVTEFWRRWHMSLSTWLRDYLYISLGGNRKGKLRTYINLMLTMLIGGLWHGASWNFVCWGGLHGIILVIERMLGVAKLSDNSKWRLLQTTVTFNLVAFIWLFFRNKSFDNSILMLQRIFTDFKPQLLPQIINGYSPIISFIVVGYIIHWLPSKWTSAVNRTFQRIPLIVQTLLTIIVIWFICQIKSSEIQPFIYFQF